MTGALGLLTLVLGYWSRRARLRAAAEAKRRAERGGGSARGSAARGLSSPPSSSVSSSAAAAAFPTHFGGEGVRERFGREGGSGRGVGGSAGPSWAGGGEGARVASGSAPGAGAGPSSSSSVGAASLPSGSSSSSLRRLFPSSGTVTLSVPGVLFAEPTSASLCEGATPVPGAAEAVSAISRNGSVRVILVAHAPDEVAEAVATAALEHAGVLALVPPHRLLFCRTHEGKQSIVRQMEPALHVEGNPDAAAALARFLPNVLLVGGQGAEAERTTAPGGGRGGKVARADSLAEALKGDGR